MKKIGLYIILSILLVSFTTVKAYALKPNDTVLIYFQSLKAGDVKTIKDLITGELFNKRKVLLEQNKSYSEFLKNVYQGAEFQITKTTIKDNNVLIHIDVNFPDRKSQFVLFLNKDADGNWKIFKEISDQ